MLEAFFVILSFAVGRWMGIQQANSVLDRSNIDELEFEILDAQNETETWKRRYDNLLLNTQSSKEQE
jgi:hypothetical protein